MKAIRDKARDYMRSAVRDYDSQEIAIQIKPSQDGFNFDPLLTPTLIDSATKRAWINPDYTKSVEAAERRTKAGEPQPKVKLPDHIRVYDSTGKLVYSK